MQPPILSVPFCRSVPLPRCLPRAQKHAPSTSWTLFPPLPGSRNSRALAVSDCWEQGISEGLVCSRHFRHGGGSNQWSRCWHCNHGRTASDLPRALRMRLSTCPWTSYSSKGGFCSLTIHCHVAVTCILLGQGTSSEGLVCRKTFSMTKEGWHLT